MTRRIFCCVALTAIVVMLTATLLVAGVLSHGNTMRDLSAAHSAGTLTTGGLLWAIAPQLLLIWLTLAALALLIARYAARRIMQPITDLSLNEPQENAAYEELLPLLNRMERQHAQIRRQMQDLSRAYGDLNAIMQNMREGLILIDDGGHILSINDSALKIFDVQGSIPPEATLSDLCRDVQVLETVSAAQTGVSGDTLMTQEDRTYRIFASPVMREEKVGGVVLLALNVTARYAAEASRREFTANVSHELKTPLTSISGYAEIIETGIAKAEDAPLFAGKIRAEARRLVALVNDILALSRLDEKQGLGAVEHVQLLPLLHELAESFGPIAKANGITLTIEGTHAVVLGYPVLLRELFHNLIENAVKYTPAGGRITVTLARREGHAVCAVADTGIGIPAEHQPHVFERFYRVDKSHSRQTGGTGLGLAIVKHVAQIHRAEIALSSAPAMGTTVTIRFADKHHNYDPFVKGRTGDTGEALE